MKVVHIPFTYFPDNCGGTEVYVQSLARGMTSHLIESIVAAPGDADESYVHDGIAVERIAFERGATLRESYGAGNPVIAAKFDAILERLQPDIAHFHAFTIGASLLMARAAQRRGIPVVFTYHTPTASCIRGTLMHHGTHQCDGVMETTRCARCALEARGAGQLGSYVLGSIPPRLGTWIGSRGRTGPAWTALRYTELTELRHSAFRELLQLAARIVVPCIWSRHVLVRNRVDTSKLVLSRQGLAEYDAEAVSPRDAIDGSPPFTGVRLAFLGRLSEEKGAHVIVEALRSVPDAAVALDLYGNGQGGEGERYSSKLRQLASGDSRVSFLPPLRNDRVVSSLRAYDALVVPSQWMETGPLVVLEAFAAGIPVIGSDLGGIAELVTNDVDGRLIPADSVIAWAEALKLIVSQRESLARWRRSVTPPRRMSQVAAEMSTLYRELVRAPRANTLANSVP